MRSLLPLLAIASAVVAENASIAAIPPPEQTASPVNSGGYEDPLPTSGGYADLPSSSGGYDVYPPNTCHAQTVNVTTTETTTCTETTTTTCTETYWNTTILYSTIYDTMTTVRSGHHHSRESLLYFLLRRSSIFKRICDIDKKIMLPLPGFLRAWFPAFGSLTTRDYSFNTSQQPSA